MSTGCQPDVGSAPKKLGRPDYLTVVVCLVCALIVFAGIAFAPSSSSWSDPVGYTLAGIYLGFALREVFR